MALFLIAGVVAPSFGDTASDELAKKLAVHFGVASESMRKERVVGGSVTIGLGALLAGAGLVFLPPVSAGEPNTVGIIVIAGGALIVGTGMLVLIFPTPTERAHARYLEPSGPSSRGGAALSDSEKLFSDAAGSEKAERIIAGAVSLGTGIASALSGGGVGYTGAGISIAVGLVGLLLPTATEREWDRYVVERDILRAARTE